MDGIFGKRKNKLYNILVLVSGIVLMGLFTFIGIFDSEADWQVLLWIISFGFLASLLAVLSLLAIHGVFFTIDAAAGTVKSKNNLFQRLDCNLDDIVFVSFQMDSLTLILKNGKKYSLAMLENADQLASAIRKENFTVEKETPKTLQRNLTKMQHEYKKRIKQLFGSFLVVIGFIIIAVLLTDGKELSEFGRVDWYIFAAVILLGSISIFFLMKNAVKSGNLRLLIEWMKYRLCSAIIASQPMPRNIIKRVLTDENCTFRLSICGFPNDDSGAVFYCVEEINEEDELEIVHTSDVLSGMDALPNEMFSTLIDITSSAAGYTNS